MKIRKTEEICKTIKAKRPKAIFLENVRHLLKHDEGKTFETIKNILENELGYSITYKVVKASDFGLPQHRPRIYIVGFRKDLYHRNFKFPEPEKLNLTMSDMFGAKCEKQIGYTIRVGGRGSGIGDRRNWDSYIVDNEVRKIGISEGIKMMGFPNNFHFPVSKTQAMKQLGNSVAVNAVRATAIKIIEFLDCKENYNEKFSSSYELRNVAVSSRVGC